MLDRTAIDAVLRGLVAFDHTDKRTLVSTPMLYPSGGTVAVRVTNEGDGVYAVSDMALGYDEAQNMGAAVLYSRVMKEVAEDAGLALSGHQLRADGVSLDQLLGAVMAVASASMTSAVVTADRQEEREKRDDVAKLISRLERLFKDVRPREQLVGSSNYKWTVDAIVQKEGRVGVFDAVSAHHSSVFPTSTKFHDLSLLENAPVCVASVKTVRDLGQFYNVLSQVGHVIEASTPDQSVARIVHG